MSQGSSEQKRSLAIAERAIRFIASNGLTADPHTYEVAYAYVSQNLPAITEEIDAVIGDGEKLTQKQADAIYDRTFTATAHADGIDNTGERVTAEIAKVMAMLANMVGMASDNADILNRTSNAINNASTPEGLKGVLKVLTTTAQKMRSEYSDLQTNLTASRQEIERLQEDLQIVRESSLRDPLTQVFNRKFFDDTLSKTMREESSEGKMALMMIDIDNFKKFNDSYGHVVGDHVLRAVGNILKSGVTGKDTVARYGGEEFGIILPETTLQAAEHVANALRQNVMNRELLRKSTGENLGRITLSIGVAMFRGADTPESLIARADRGLYAAKRSGRNKVVCETDPEFEANAA